MSDFDYLGEVKLGSSVVVKPTKKRQPFIVRMAFMFASGLVLSAGFFFGSIAFAQFQKLPKSPERSEVVAQPSETPASAPAGSTPTPSIKIDRGDYNVSGTSVNKKAKAKPKKKVKVKSSPTPSFTPSPEPTGHYVPRPTPKPTPTPTPTPPRPTHG